MLRKVIWIIGIYILGACSSVPITGRSQLNLLPGSEMRAMAVDQYEQMLQESNVVTGTENSRMVKEVGQNIADAVEQYLQEQGKADLVKDFNWEFKLLGEDVINAWAMPGGKVAFYEGIMPVCKDANGVAVVMGHEVAHAIARHGNERMSQGLVQQAGGMALAVAINEKPAETQQLFMTAYGVASQVGAMLPFSRLHESEADEMGLTFMALAGYDPREAPEFWSRMAAQSEGGQPPEFLSTHPSHENRIEKLNELMPQAMEKYRNTQGTAE